MLKKRVWILLAAVAGLGFFSGAGAQPYAGKGRPLLRALRSPYAAAKGTGEAALRPILIRPALPVAFKPLPPLTSQVVSPSAPDFRPLGYPAVCPVWSKTWQEQQAARQRRIFPGRERIDAVIFDMDGTLLDSIPAWDHAATKYLRTRGIDLPEDIQEYIKHISLLEGAEYIKEKLRLPDAPEVLMEGTLSVVRQRYLYEVPAKPGAEQLLKHLKSQGIKICVATASDDVLARGAFERLGLMPYIDFIIGCNEVGVGKQSPAVYEAALARLGTEKARTLVVEDALYAIKTAQAAGFPTAGVPDPVYPAAQLEELKRTADYFFSSFESSLK